jgi:5S rRNA maturation endonuclease (ribonuclease M5)
LRRYFDEIIIFADNDEAGVSMQKKLVSNLCGYLVRIVSYEGLAGKDAGEMSADDLRAAIVGAEDALTAGTAPS